MTSAPSGCVRERFPDRPHAYTLTDDVEAVYEDLPGWGDTAAGIPAELEAYILRIENAVGVPVKLVSTGGPRTDHPPRTGRHCLSHGPAPALGPRSRGPCGPAGTHPQTSCQGELPAFRSSLDDAPVEHQGEPSKSMAARKVCRSPWCNSGRYLTERPVFTLDPCFMQAPTTCRRPPPCWWKPPTAPAFPGRGPSMALDLRRTWRKEHPPAPCCLRVPCWCATGGRASPCGPGREPVEMGGTNVMPTGRSCCRLPAIPGTFGLVLVDTLLRRRPHASWTGGQAVMVTGPGGPLCVVQQGLLDDAWASLAPGGTLIYSTSAGPRRRTSIKWRP